MFRLSMLEETTCISFLYMLWPSESFFLFFMRSSGKGNVLSCSTFMVNLMFGCILFRCYRTFCSTYKLIYYIYPSDSNLFPMWPNYKSVIHIPLTMDCLFHIARKTLVQRLVLIDWLLLELVAIPQQHHQCGHRMCSQATSNVIVRTWWLGL
jgi:hypothetical protein